MAEKPKEKDPRPMLAVLGDPTGKFIKRLKELQIMGLLDPIPILCLDSSSESLREVTKKAEPVVSSKPDSLSADKVAWPKVFELQHKIIANQ